MTSKPVSASLFDPEIPQQAEIDAFLKLTAKQQWKHLVMFVVYLGSLPTTVASSGSNLGSTNPTLADAVTARILALKDADPASKAPVPVDFVTASGNGIDPCISIAAAEYQIKRIAKVRKINEAKLHELVNAHTEDRQWLVFDEPRVNVLKLNPALNQAHH